MTPEEKNRLEYLERIVADVFLSDRFIFNKTIQIANGRNILCGNGLGTKIGTASTQKMALWGATPVVQASAIGSPSATLADLKTAVDAIRVAIKNAGITA